MPHQHDLPSVYVLKLKARNIQNIMWSSSLASALPICIALFILCIGTNEASGASGSGGTPGITPIPMELLNPRLTEFRRIDSSGDDQINFSEFLLSDRPWMETMSRRFHSIDANSDGRVTRREFESFYRGKDEEQERQRNQADNFFKQLTVTVGPIVEREQEGDANNGSRRMRYFRAGSRKYATITHGTGLFPSPSSASSPSSVEVPGALLRDHDHHFRMFPHRPQFLLPSSSAILGQFDASPEQQQQVQIANVTPQQALPSGSQRERNLKNDVAGQL